MELVLFRPRFGFLPFYLLVVYPWTNHLILLSFNFLISIWELIIPLYYSTKIEMKKC